MTGGRGGASEQASVLADARMEKRSQVQAYSRAPSLAVVYS